MILDVAPVHLHDLHALEQRCAARPWSLDALRGVVDGSHGAAWILPARGYLFGHQVLDEAEIHGVGVVADARRSGLGRRLLDHALSAWSARGIIAVHLEVRDDNLAARTLYERAGFVGVGRRERYYGDVDALLLRRSL